MNVMMNPVDNSTNFKASMTIYNSKHKKALEALQEGFKEATKNYPNDKLHIKYVSGGSYEFRLKSKGIPFRALDKNNFDKMMSSYLDDEIVEKLVTIFKILKRDTEYNKKTNEMLALIDDAKSDAERNEMQKKYISYSDKYSSVTREELGEDEVLMHIF